MKLLIFIVASMWIPFIFSPVVNGQAVPSAVKKEVISLLKKHDALCENENATISVESVRVGPRRYGYISSCKYGGGPSVLFEKTANGLRKLLAVDTGMNGYFYPGKGVSKGYYDMSHSERSGEEVYVTIYRWNGGTYVAQKEKRVR
jgi:hypothetical protein